MKRLIKTKNKKIFYRLNRTEIKALPEINYAQENKLSIGSWKLYRYFYFENNYSEYALKDNAGVILLHNSWTPEEYRNMTESEFLACDNTLSNILKTILI